MKFVFTSFSPALILATAFLFSPPHLAQAAPRGEFFSEVKMLSTAFIAPNENEIDAFKKIMIGRKGAYIAVGSFRVFNTSQYGTDLLTVGFDYAHSTAPFNRFFERLLKSDLDRRLLLAILTGKKLDAHAIKDAKRGKISEEEFLKWIFSDKDLNAWPSSERDPYFKDFSEYDPFYKLPKALRESFSTTYKTSKKQWAETIFGSDERFEAVQKRAHEGRFLFATGNLVGSKPFALMADYLKKVNVPVTAIDVSNSMDYFTKILTDAAQSLNDAKNFVANLKKLDYTPDAVILFSISNSRLLHDGNPLFMNSLNNPRTNLGKIMRDAKEQFAYFSMPVKDLINDFSKNPMPMSRFLAIKINSPDFGGITVENPDLKKPETCVKTMEKI